MTKFTDALGREWPIDITVLDVREVRRLTGFDLLGFATGDQSSVQRLVTDVVLLVDILWVLVKSQAESKNIDERSFAQGLVRNGIDAGTDALMRALADFIAPRAGAILKQLWEKNSQAVDAALSQAERRANRLEVSAEKISQLVDQVFDEVVSKVGTNAGDSFSKPQPQLVSNAGNIHSAN